MKLKQVTQSLFLAFGLFAVAQSAAQQAPEFKSAEPRKKVILWDLGYVLVKPNTLKMSMRYIMPYTCGLNPWNAVRLGLLYKNGFLTPNKIQAQMDAVMDHARPNEPKQTMIVDQHGNPHTNIDADYQTGAKPDKELFAEIEKSITSLEEADKKKDAADKFFQNPAHKYLIHKTLEMRYMAPKFFGESFTPIKPGVELLEKCKNAGHEQAVLSNWGAQSFPYLKAHASTQTIFKHFKPEHIFASGEIKKAKPYAEAFEHVTQAMNVQPADVIFIDDQIRNIEAARKVGMNAIHVTDYKDPAAYAQVEAELKNLGAL